jgi:hypothetical protein
MKESSGDSSYTDHQNHIFKNCLLLVLFLTPHALTAWVIKQLKSPVIDCFWYIEHFHTDIDIVTTSQEISKLIYYETKK